MKKERYYFDTSVFGGVFDEGFTEPSVALFSRVKAGEIVCVYSELTLQELINAPEYVRRFLQELSKEQLEFLKLSEEAYLLANTYLQENVVGRSSHEDCLQIAMATISRVHVLASWNFKHIVNLTRIPGYNSVNLRLGYPVLEIRSPIELLQ